MILGSCISQISSKKSITIASRDFPESILLAEILATAIERYSNYQVIRKFNLGSSQICFNNPKIDIYPDYTASLANIVLGREQALDYKRSDLKEKLKSSYGLNLSEPIGFDNNFVLIANKDFARQYKLKNISDLKQIPKDKFKTAFSHNFLYRIDGYQQINKTYDLKLENILTMEHNLALQAILNNQVQIIDSFTTDPRLYKNKNLIRLMDDKTALINYDAVFISKPLDPVIEKILGRLNNSINNEQIIELNQLILSGKSYETVASDFVNQLYLDKKENKQSLSKLELLSQATIRHLELSIIAILIASLLGITIGASLSYNEVLGKYCISIISAIQTIPSLALLALLIPLLGLGIRPSIFALIIYSLLPIIQNTYSAMKGIDRDYIDAARTMSMSSLQIFWHIKLPLAKPFIIAGIKTATVICIATATLATFVGGGGLGDLIKAGIQLNDNQLILLGALPVSLLAWVSSYALSQLERT